jgi:hypothetical protein
MLYRLRLLGLLELFVGALRLCRAGRTLTLSLLPGLLSSAALAITFADKPAAPSVAWTSAQTANSVDCEMHGANLTLVYIGQCQDGVPHGRGLLLSMDKGIEGAKMDRGSPYARVPVATLQDVQAYAERARYLLAFHRIAWTPDNFGQYPGPHSSGATAVAAQFIAQWAERDSDGLVARARDAQRQATARAQTVAWAAYRQRASHGELTASLSQWQGVASAEQQAEAERIAAQRLRQEYDRDFAAIQGEDSARRFISTYAGYDPDRRLPQARERQAAYALATRRQAEAQADAEAAKRRREAANPVCMAQKQSCMAQCASWSNDSARWRCEFGCERIRCD